MEESYTSNNTRVLKESIQKEHSSDLLILFVFANRSLTLAALNPVFLFSSEEVYEKQGDWREMESQ